MEKNLTEIKKALYKEKPNAKRTIRQTNENTLVKIEPYDRYITYLDCLDETVVFIVPHNEQGENLFEEQIPAQLLIRWIVNP